MKRLLLPVLLVVSTVVSGKTFYVAPNGSDLNNGTTLSTPFATWQRGINMAYPGDTIFIRGGVYYVTGYDNFPEINPAAYPTPKGRCGTRDKKIYLWAYPPDFEAGNKPILDCKDGYTQYYTNFGGFSLNMVQYWHIKGLTVRNLYQREGPKPAGTYNYKMPQGISGTNSANIIFENCTVHDISGRGFYFESGAWNEWDGADAPWDSDTTRWINCDAYNLCDSLSLNPGNAADGWKCGNYIGGVFIWEGCRAWNYSDDGIDPNGAGKRFINNSWVMSTLKYAPFDIEGNGIKTSGIGADQISHYNPDDNYVVIRNCIAANCNYVGFYNNLEAGAQNNAIYENNSSFNCYSGFGDVFHPTVRGTQLRNNMVFQSTSSEYEQTMIYDPSTYPAGNNTWIPDPSGWPGWKYNPAVTVTSADFLSLDASQLTLPRKPDGSLPDITFLKLREGSDLIDAGVYVGLPYSGSAPDIGYAEYGSGPVTPPAPTYVSAVIQNATPDKLEMTYSLTLANIIPATTAFTVKVNTVTRSVSSVAVSGTKVTLTLSSPVVSGDAVTVAYTRPTANPLQTPDGGQVATFTAKNVTNNVSTVVPVYVSSVIENATPSRLEITYNLPLANIIPASTAFAVKVNTVTRAISSVSISGTKVYLTLATPVAYGDAVTVAYTRPATNPLQTAEGGLAATFTAKNVTNNVAAPVPVYVSSVVENATPSRLEMTYSLSLTSIAPATSAFTVKVNTVTRTVSSVSVSGTKVYLNLSSPVVYGDAVTVAYTRPAANPLQTAEGAYAATITAQNVINNCSAIPNQPPLVNISSPTKNSAFVSPATITIDAVASDPDGSVVKVEFYNGQSKLGEKTAAPYSFTWKEVPEGTYIITAVATDNLSARTVSSSVTVVVEKAAQAVNQLPEVIIKNPTRGKKFKKNETIVLEAEASDPDGTISKVEFKSGDVTLAEVTEAPYIYLWQNADTGTYIITAVATDNLGAVSQSTGVELSVVEMEIAGFGIVKLYPNPTDGHFSIDMSGVAENERRFTIYSLTGQALHSEQRPGEEVTMDFDFPEMPAGTYVVAVSSGNRIIDSRKFIKR
jgi:uncharacterized repeat protein (TIGR02059 family)